MKLENIGFYTLSDFRVRQASFTSPLWRCELILTERCNFNCAYCRGLRPDCKEELSLDYAKKIVNYWSDEGLKNIRFSGGEPTLFEGLPELVTLSKIRGVERIALSTNGSADSAYYKRLADLGVNDFSISFDACCASFGDMMAGRDGVWSTVVRNIEMLSKMTYVTVGVVLTEVNANQVRGIIEYAHMLGVSDIRVISSAQTNQFVDEILDVNQDILTQHPILKYRANNILHGRHMRGLKPTDNHRCPLVLDDMAVAGSYHFPCIIYMREHGAPIGNTSDLSSIRRDRYLWFKKHDTYMDKICRKNCLDVCIDYNNKFDNEKLLNRKDVSRQF